MVMSLKCGRGSGRGERQLSCLVTLISHSMCQNLRGGRVGCGWGKICCGQDGTELGKQMLHVAYWSLKPAVAKTAIKQRSQTVIILPFKKILAWGGGGGGQSKDMMGVQRGTSHLVE